MFGSGVLKGLGVTLKEFVATYVDDVKKIPSRYAGGKEELDQTAASAQNGIFTVQYPEERRKLSERFRYIPMLVYDAETGEDRCTACGICAKVCPPQCIWIVRAKDEKGKPITQPAEFFIDTTICMNCGLCAEFCPFDAIKMNNDYEIAAQQRMPYLLFDLKELRVPTTYYARIRPTDWVDEEAARAAKEAEKAARPERPPKVEAGSSKLEATPAPVVDVAPAATVAAAAVAVPAVVGKRTPEEVERLKAEAAARRAAKATESGDAAAPTPVVEASPATAAIPAAAGVPAVAGKRTPEEIEQLKAEAAARRAAKASGEAPAAAPAPAIVPEAPSAPVAEAAPGESPAVAPVSVPVPQPPAEPVAATTPPEPPATEAVQAAPAVTGVGAKRTPEEIERLKAEAAARRAAKAG